MTTIKEQSPVPVQRATSPVRGRVVRSAGGRLSFRVDARAVVVGTVLLGVTLVVAVVTMTTGEYSVSVPDVIATLFGRGNPATHFIVTTLRLPRLLTALLVGAALGISGAILQSLSRNPLGSPDFIGFTTGAATGAITVILVFHGGTLDIAAGALAGAIGTFLLVYGLTLRRGAQGFRLILIGVGVNSILLSVNAFLITRVTLDQALDAQGWLVGSLNGRGWEQVVPVSVALLVLLPPTLYFARHLSMLEMGDDRASSLGVRVERSRLVLVITSVALVGLATAAAGPIAFVALAAPQLARRLTRSSGPVLIPAAMMGALVLSASDLVAQRALAPAQLPVGVATAAVGGMYLAWLLVRDWRKGPG